MTEDAINWIPLEPGQLRVMRIGGAIWGLISLALVAGLTWIVWESVDPGFWTLFWIVLVPLVMMIAWLCFAAPPRRFRRWGYARQCNELHVARGVLTHTETSISFHRVQHIDVSQGLIERMCGVTRLVLNTAGTMNSRITLPGLSRETAEALRDEIRAHIRDDLG